MNDFKKQYDFLALKKFSGFLALKLGDFLALIFVDFLAFLKFAPYYWVIKHRQVRFTILFLYR